MSEPRRVKTVRFKKRYVRHAIDENDVTCCGIDVAGTIRAFRSYNGKIEERPVGEITCALCLFRGAWYRGARAPAASPGHPEGSPFISSSKTGRESSRHTADSTSSNSRKTFGKVLSRTSPVGTARGMPTRCRETEDTDARGSCRKQLPRASSPKMKIRTKNILAPLSGYKNKTTISAFKN